MKRLSYVAVGLVLAGCRDEESLQYPPSREPMIVSGTYDMSGRILEENKSFIKEPELSEREVEIIWRDTVSVECFKNR